MKTPKKSKKIDGTEKNGFLRVLSLIFISAWSGFQWLSKSLYDNQIRNLKLLFVFLSGSHFIPVYQYNTFHGIVMSVVVGFAFAYAEYSVTDKYSGFWDTKTKFGSYREENPKNLFRKWWLDKGLYMILLISVVVNTHYYIVQTKLFKSNYEWYFVLFYFFLGLLYSTVFPLFVFVLSMADDRAERIENNVEQEEKQEIAKIAEPKKRRSNKVLKIDEKKYKKPNPNYAPVVKGRNNKRK